MVDYPTTTRDKFYTAVIIIGVLLYAYGRLANSEHSSWFIEIGKILLYAGIALFLIDRFIKIVKKKQ